MPRQACTNDPSDALIELAKVVKLTKLQIKEYEKRINRWAEELCTSFLCEWRHYRLDEDVQSILAWQISLNTALFAILNSHGESSTSTGSLTKTGSLGKLLRGENAFVTVTAVNRLSATGIPTTAAVLTRANGQIVLINAEGDDNEDSTFNEGRLINYNAQPMFTQPSPAHSTTNSLPNPHVEDEDQRSAQQRSQSPLDPVRSGATISHDKAPYGKTFTGDVDVRDHGRAHLGDNHIHGNIHIDKFIVVDKDSEMSTESIARTPRHSLLSTKKINLQSPAIVCETIQQSLYFEEEPYRKEHIKGAHQKTFGWILQSSSSGKKSILRQWLVSDKKCFWIQGKAGSGKSTLMKYMYNHPAFTGCLKQWANGKVVVQCGFFFWHAGTTLQKSHDGILRSILYQIFDQRPELASLAFPRLYLRLFDRDQNERTRFRTQDLQQALSRLLQNLPVTIVLFIMIDGVDEYVGDHYEFSRFLLQISKHRGVKVLVSSRPIPACYQIFSRCPSIRLQDLTADDMQHYVEEELTSDPLFQEMDMLHHGFAEQVITALAQKASGVFLWIILVVRELLRCLGRYDSYATIMAKIDDLPTELEKLYDHMFAQLTRQEQRDGSRLLQFVYRALQVEFRGMDALQLYFADEYGVGDSMTPDNESVLTAEDEALRLKACEGRLRSRCCGLVEVQHRNESTSANRVDWLHRTVADFLTEPARWIRVKETFAMDDQSIDMVLISAAVRVLRCVHFEPSGATADSRFSNIYHACLAYWRNLHTSQEQSISDELILIADERLLVHCQSESILDQALGCQPYNSVYDTFDFSPNVRQLHNMGQRNSRGTTAPLTRQKTFEIALYCMALGDMTTLLARRLEDPRFNASATGAVFWLLMWLCKKSSAVDDSMHWDEACRLLLKFADPNVFVLQGDESNDYYLLQAAALSESGSDVSSWYYWLIYMDVWSNDNQEHGRLWKITLYLLRAGAHIGSLATPQARAKVAQLFEHVKVQVSRELTSKGELLPVLKEIHEKLAAANASQKGTRSQDACGQKVTKTSQLPVQLNLPSPRPGTPAKSEVSQDTTQSPPDYKHQGVSALVRSKFRKFTSRRE